MPENVSARRQQRFPYLPAGPHFRLGKEIKLALWAAALLWGPTAK
jgi:hypothetical protein